MSNKKIVSVIILLGAVIGTLSAQSVNRVSYRRAIYPKIHIYKPDRGPTRDLRKISNSDCRPIHYIDSTILDFMARESIVGASLAVTRGDSLVYAKGYGWADRDAGKKMTPSTIMRVASVSKLITAIGIMKLCEEGELSLQDKVFGNDGILCDSDLVIPICDERILDITVEHLLRHQGGFGSKVVDPMFCYDGGLEGREVLRRNLACSLDFAPGTSQDYSNLGYYALTLVIEKITDSTYEKWMRKNVFEPCCCRSFRIAGSYLADRHPGEAHYYMYPGAELEKDSVTGEMVETCYGGNNVGRLLGAGAWAASAVELCRLVAAIDSDWGIRDILSDKSIDLMTQYINPDTYSLGWNDTNEVGIWTRTGSFGGTTALIKYYSWDGDCWVLLTNTGTPYGAKVAKRTGALVMDMRKNCLGLFEKKDLFY